MCLLSNLSKKFFLLLLQNVVILYEKLENILVCLVHFLIRSDNILSCHMVILWGMLSHFTSIILGVNQEKNIRTKETKPHNCSRRVKLMQEKTNTLNQSKTK